MKNWQYLALALIRYVLVAMTFAALAGINAGLIG